MSAEDAAAQELPVGRIAVVGGEPSQREELVEALRSLGHEIVREAVPADADDAGDAWVDVDAVLIVADERDRDWTGLANAIRHHAAPPPLVVLGPNRFRAGAAAPSRPGRSSAPRTKRRRRSCSRFLRPQSAIARSRKRSICCESSASASAWVC